MGYMYRIGGVFLGVVSGSLFGSSMGIVAFGDGFVGSWVTGPLGGFIGYFVGAYIDTKINSVDDHTYSIVQTEINGGFFDPALMAKAKVEAGGDQNKAEAAYIKLRAIKLINEAKQAGIERLEAIKNEEALVEQERFLNLQQELPIRKSELKQLVQAVEARYLTIFWKCFKWQFLGGGLTIAIYFSLFRNDFSLTYLLSYVLCLPLLVTVSSRTITNIIYTRSVEYTSYLGHVKNLILIEKELMQSVTEIRRPNIIFGAFIWSVCISMAIVIIETLN